MAGHGWMRAAASVIAVVAATTGPAPAADPTMLRVNVFPGVGNLAVFAGQAKGFFTKHDLKVELQFTQDSPSQRAGLAKGAFEIAHASVDNAVAMVEGGVDAVIVMGGDSSLQELFVQPTVKSFEDLRGKTAIVDAPNTAYALLLKKILLLKGLQAGRDYTIKPTGSTMIRYGLMKEHKDYAASMLNPPFSIQASREGFRSLGVGSVLVGRYQGVGAFVMRSWAQANAATLERYIAAYVDALRWVVNSANKHEASAFLAERLKVPPDVAAATWERAADPVSGLAPDAKLDVEGFKTTLAIRAETEGQWGGKPPAPDKYYDLSYYERALNTLAK